MVMARWTATVQDAEGNAVPGCDIEVRNANTGLLVQVYGDRDGTVELGNPFTAEQATFGFHVPGGAYRIMPRKDGVDYAPWNYVGIGTMGEFDFESIAFELEAGLYPAATLADLNAYVPGEGQTLAGIVLNDPDASNNGYYLWSGAAWVWQRGLPDTLARLTAIGGTPNALEVQASPGVDPGAALAFFIDPLAPNTGPVTIKINGDDPVPAYDYTGEDFVAGAFSGRLFLTREQDGSLRSLMPADLAARAAASALEAKTEADRATLAAQSVVARAFFKTVPDLIADNNEIGYSGSGAAFEVEPGDVVSAGPFRYEVAASSATDQHVTTAGGVKLYVLPNAEGAIVFSAMGSGQAAFERFVTLPNEGLNYLVLDQDVTIASWTAPVVTQPFKLIGRKSGFKPTITGPAAFRKKLIQCGNEFSAKNLLLENFDLGFEVLDELCPSEMDLIELNGVDTINVQVPLYFQGPVAATSRVEKVRYVNCYNDGWVYGFRQDSSPAVNELEHHDNVHVNGIKSAINSFATNLDSGYANRLLVDAFVHHNVVRNVYAPIGETTDAETVFDYQGQEVHGFLVRAINTFVTDNVVENLDAEIQRGVEAIYTKSIHAMIRGNRCHDAHRRQAAITAKTAGTENRLAETAIITDNQITWSNAYKASYSPSGGTAEGWGIYTQDVQRSVLIANNTIDNCQRGIAVRLSGPTGGVVHLSDNVTDNLATSSENIIIFDNERRDEENNILPPTASLERLMIGKNSTDNGEIMITRVNADEIVVIGGIYGGINFRGGAVVTTFAVLDCLCAGMLVNDANTVIKSLTMRDNIRHTGANTMLTVASPAHVRSFAMEGNDARASQLLRWTSAADPVVAHGRNNYAAGNYDTSGGGRTPANTTFVDTTVVSSATWSSILA